MNTKLAVLPLVFLILSSYLSAGPDTCFASQYLASYPLSLKQAVKAPAHWDSDEWIMAGSLALAAGGLYLADPEIRRMNQGIKPG